MENSKFGLLGEKLGHSHSPQIYEMFKIPGYELFEVPREDVHTFLKTTQLEGLNVTIPYKKIAMEQCDYLSETAKRLGNVNTIRFKDGKLYGDNTDYYGFTFMLKELKLSFKGKKVLILGTGGSAQTVHAAAQDMGAEQIVHLSRNPQPSHDWKIDSYDNLIQYADFHFLVNATPVGMAPDLMVQAISLEGFTGLEGVIDLVYNPIRTKLVLDARSRNIPAIGGLLMLVAQAKKAAELYLDKEIPDQSICTIYNMLLHKLENVVFVGMPGSGKTTIGSEIAQKMNRQFVDIDHYIEMTTHMHPAEWIIHKGEGAFREVETQALHKISSMSGIVIAPGGGGILSNENRIALKQNSRVYWLNRTLAKLDRANRPLSTDLEALYEARRALYEAVSDYAVENEDRNSHLVADKIIDEFYQPRGPVCL